MITQWIIVAIILLFALAYVGQKVYHTLKGRNKCSCCSKDCPMNRSKV